MPNMNYCRFQNTLTDFNDCLAELDGLDGDISDLSDEEKAAALELLDAAYEFTGWSKKMETFR